MSERGVRPRRLWAVVACLSLSLLVHALALQAPLAPLAVGRSAVGSDLRKSARLQSVRVVAAKTAQYALDAVEHRMSPGPVPGLAASPPAAAKAEQTSGDEWEAYLPRPLLTLPPLPRVVDPVLLEWPGAESALDVELDPATTRYVGVLALYIDEVGLVRFARPQGGELPEALAKAAVRAFVGVHFFPGELNGEPVKSRIFVEVSFDRPEPPAAPRGLIR